MIDPNEVNNVVGDFEGEVWLSTDGKHTVRIKANTPENRQSALVWAKEIYEAIVDSYGTKQAQAVKEYNKNGSNPFKGTTVSQAPQNLGNCKDCGAPNKLSRFGKPYCSAKC